MNGIKEIKVVFAGLDNVGKTTIIQYLQKQITFHDQMKPTQGLKISNQTINLLGLDIAHWDLGGQEKYRKDYLQDKQKYFTNVNLLIYMIDIKENKRLKLALNYLKEILDAIKEINETPKICILFHKFDSESIPELKEITNKLKQKISEKYPSETISFYKTSIYYPISIIRAFSDIMTQISAKPELVHNLLKEYRKKTASAAVLLFDTPLMFVEGISEKGEYVKVLDLVGEIYSSGIEKLEQFSLVTSEIVSEVKLDQGSGDFKEGTLFIRVLNKDPRLYLITLTLDKESNLLTYQFLDDLKKKLLIILYD